MERRRKRSSTRRRRKKSRMCEERKISRGKRKRCRGRAKLLN